MAEYKFQTGEPDSGVYRYADKTVVPNAEGNKSWRDYQDYVANGGLTDPYKTFEENKVDKVNQVKRDCEAYIHSYYPATIQSSMSLGIYPPWIIDAASETIALCIDEENRINDLIMATSNQAELDAVEDPVWPDPIEPVDPTA